jgi:ribosomal protein S18 acetylase RimI-like enzyme
MDIREFRLEDEQAVVALWERCGLVMPWNDPHRDIARKLTVRPDLFLVGTIEGRIVAAVMAGYDGHRGWLNYLAVAPEARLRGYGRMIVAEAEKRLRAAGCPKINLQIRRGNTEVMSFYTALGYCEDAVVSMGKRLETDEPVSEPKT